MLHLEKVLFGALCASRKNIYAKATTRRKKSVTQERRESVDARNEDGHGPALVSPCDANHAWRIRIVVDHGGRGLGNQAYGAAMREEIAATTGRKSSIGALYKTIERLENKGLLKAWMGDATPQRGGRAKRMVRVTPKGVQAAKHSYDSVMRVSCRASWIAD
jgi:hypothetical protein